MNTTAFQQEFFKQLDGSSGSVFLFDFIPDIQLFMKNRKSQLVKVNRAFLIHCGMTHEHEALGKTDLDLFDHHIGQQYIDEDRKVMKLRKPLIDQVWVVPNSDGILIWYLCTKVPLYNHEGEVIGLAGTLRTCSNSGSLPMPYYKYETVIDFIYTNYAQNIAVEELAAIIHLSRSQFERQFKKLFHLSPLKYVNKVRLHQACLLLKGQDDITITQIALDCGFYDHSHFTKVFTREIGLPPKQYRKQNRSGKYAASHRSTRNNTEEREAPRGIFSENYL
jgi:AraC-like DNA-binding protein